MVQPAVNLAEMIRKRPGMYVGDTDGSGILHLVLEVLANSYDQHLAGRCAAVAIELEADGTVTVTDDGPGILATSLGAVLTHVSDTPTVDGHRPHVHLGLGGIGLAMVNALSERLEVVTIRDAVEAKASCVRGVLVEPIATAATRHASGTTVRFRPDPMVFTHVRVPRTELAQHLEDLAFLAPGLALTWRVGGDDCARGGLAARVALAVPCAVAEVARVVKTYATTLGPIDVDVALAWTAPDEEARFDSFVNLARTRDRGSHVDGVVDGVRRFLGASASSTQGLVAAVAVTLADVTYGEPKKERLETPEAREPVASATYEALVAWEAAYPAIAAAVRARRAQLAADSV